MRYESRNLTAINSLAPNTKAAALKWYDFCKSRGAEILITEGIRTEEKQREYVAKGTSKTMQSYHLVGQALDFVPVDAKGNPLWAWSAYRTPIIQDCIRFAKSLGFEAGYDWGWDAPHLQFNYKGYGTDKVLDKSKVQTIYFVTGGFPEGSDAANAFEEFMKSRKWWYKKEVQS